MGESSEKDDRGIGEEKNSNSDGSSSPTTTQFMGSATVGGTNNDNLTALDVHDIESGNEGSLKRRLLSADYSNVLRGDVMEEEDSSDDDQDYEDIGLQSWMPKQVGEIIGKVYMLQISSECVNVCEVWVFV